MPSDNSSITVSLHERAKDETDYRVLPHNYEAEQALLGAILVRNAAFDRVSDFLQPEHFADPVHGRIFAAAMQLIARGQLANPVTLKGFFETDGELSKIGGQKYLARLAASAVTVINAADYGRTIHDLYLRRQLIALGEDVVNEAFETSIEQQATEQIESAEQRLFDLATAGTVEGGFQTFERSLQSAIQAAEHAYQRDGQLTGVSTGLRDLDGILGGLHSSDLVILAGRPSMGKTALATNIAYHAARTHRTESRDGVPETVNGGVVGFFSLEMSAEQLATRILAEESGLSSDRIRRGDVSADGFQSLVQASAELAQLPFHIDDTPALTVSALRTRARRLKRTQGLDLVVIDYLQLLRPTVGTRADNRVQEISDITRGLKALAKELNVPVLALSQLSRAVEQRDDKRPQLADLRESGSIEQDADVVMFIYREEYYLERKEPSPGTTDHATWQESMEKVHNLAEVIIAKQRHGPVGRVTLHFAGASTKFSDYVRDDRLPDAPH
ncbi:MAG: replicative DNA helicase [Alphaproteobacteria bacterium]